MQYQKVKDATDSDDKGKVPDMTRAALFLICLAPVMTIGSMQTRAQNAAFTDHGFIPDTGIHVSVFGRFQTAMYGDGHVFVATSNGVWKNNVGNAQWSSSGLQGKIIIALYKHPSIANRMFAGALTGPFGQGNTIPLFISSDGGNSWNAASNAVNENYYCFAARPGTPNHIYANVEGPNIAVSTDGGNTWGFMNNNGGGFMGYSCNVTFIPTNPGQIYQGAESPLDDAWLGRYDISATNPLQLMNFTKIVHGVNGPWDNRRPTELKTYTYTGTRIYVGQEGALSKVNGSSTKFIYESLGGPGKPYSYIYGFWVDQDDTNHVIFGGALNNSTQPMQLYETFNEGATFHRYTNTFGTNNPEILEIVDTGNRRLAVIINDQGANRVKLIMMQPQPVVPVTLLSFTANRDHTAVHLTWITLAETNNFGFEVQRLTDADSRWKSIGFVAGSGTGSFRRTYRYRDQLDRTLLDADRLLYRLRQIDNDGSSEYSPIVEATIGGSQGALSLHTAWPNPASRKITVRYSLPDAVSARLTVYSIVGQEMASFEGDELSGGGEHILSMNTASFPPGGYLVELTADNARLVRQFVVKR